MAYTIKGPNGQPNAVECEPKLTEEENGMVFIDVTIEPTDNNKKFIKDVTEHWTISGVKKSQYGDFHIQNLEKVGVGEWPTLKIKAVADFIFKLQTTTFDGYFTGSRTAVSFFAELSRQSGITFEPIDFKEAFGWEKFGLGVHTMDEFNRGLNNYGYTYYPVTPQIIHLRDRIGRDTNFMIKNAMNSSDMKVEIDRSEVFTYAQGYADYSEDDEDANFYKNAALWDEYKHPTLYNLLGKLSAPVYTNQKINNKATLNAYLKKIVDESIKFTITTDFHQIPDYPFAVPMLGDRIRVQDDAIDIDETARAIKIKTYFDSYGEPINYEIDFGNLRVAQREKSRLDEVQRAVEDLLSGRNPVGTGMVDNYIKSVIQGFKSAETEVRFNGYNGMNGLFLVDPTDENDAVGLFSKGIAVTQNGFQGGAQDNLAIVPSGIVADWIRVGTLWLERFLGIIGRDSLLQITADEIRLEDARNPNNFTSLKPGTAVFSQSLSVIRDDGVYWIQNGQPRFEIPIITKTNMDIGVSFSQRNYETFNEVFSLFEVGYASHSGRYANFVFLPGLRWDSTAPSTLMEISIEVANAPAGVDIQPVVHRQTVYRDQPNESVVLNVPLPPPTYGALSFLLKFRSMSIHDTNIITIRSARAWISA